MLLLQLVLVLLVLALLAGIAWDIVPDALVQELLNCPTGLLALSLLLLLLQLLLLPLLFLLDNLLMCMSAYKYPYVGRCVCDCGLRKWC